MAWNTREMNVYHQDIGAGGGTRIIDENNRHFEFDENRREIKFYLYPNGNPITLSAYYSPGECVIYHQQHSRRDYYSGHLRKGTIGAYTLITGHITRNATPDIDVVTGVEMSP